MWVLVLKLVYLFFAPFTFALGVMLAVCLFKSLKYRGPERGDFGYEALVQLYFFIAACFLTGIGGVMQFFSDKLCDIQIVEKSLWRFVLSGMLSLSSIYLFLLEVKRMRGRSRK